MTGRPKLDLERAREFYRAALHWQKQPCHESTAAEDYKLGAALEDANTLPALLAELEAARAVVAAAEDLESRRTMDECKALARGESPANGDSLRTALAAYREVAS